jgi:dTDP-4-dehydrorhamnose reductase/dTDP-4-dehydrorhamnose 3,5-epimerase
MNTTQLPVCGASLIVFKRHGDSRGYFNELFNCEKYDQIIAKKEWKQISFSNSSKGVLRGLHCSPYGKFITCTSGSFYDVIADFRHDSPTFGRWCKILLTHENCRQVYVPSNCGHGFYTLEDNTSALYLQEGCFDSAKEKDTHPFDSFVNVQWPISAELEPTLSQKDTDAPYLSDRLTVPSEPRKRIIVIGATGQIGSALLENFGPSNCIGTYCSSMPAPGMIHYDMERAHEPNYSEFLFDCVNPTHLFICTGFTWVDGCENNTEKCTILNRTAPLYLCELAKKNNCKPIWFSTDYVFDGKDGPYNELSQPNPINEYGRAKLMGENEILKNNSNALIIRTNVVYGPETAGKNFAYQIGHGRLKCVPIDQFGTPTYSRDIAVACNKLIEINATGIVHVSGSEFLSREQFTRKVQGNLSAQHNVKFISTIELDQIAKRPLKAGLSNIRIHELINWIPRSVDEALQHWKRNPRGLLLE